MFNMIEFFTSNPFSLKPKCVDIHTFLKFLWKYIMTKKYHVYRDTAFLPQALSLALKLMIPGCH